MLFIFSFFSQFCVDFFIFFMHFYMDYAVHVPQIYNERRLFYGGGAGAVPNDSFGSVSSSSNTDKRGPRSRGMQLFLVFIRGWLPSCLLFLECHWVCLQLFVKGSVVDIEFQSLTFEQEFNATPLSFGSVTLYILGQFWLLF